MSQISCENVSLGYEGQIVTKNINFEVNKGDYLCIVGENGSGKSTLVKALLGLLKPISGSINKEGFVVGFAFFQHHNAGRNGSSKEQVAWQLNNAVDKIVVDQVFSDFLLCTATVHNAGEADDCCRAACCQP